MARLTISTKIISQRSGMPVRQIQSLTDGGALIADEGTESPGRGGSRQYPLWEEEVASLLSPIACKGMPVAEAKGIAETLRSIVCAPEEFGFKGLDQARKLNRYLAACLAIPGPPIPDHQFMDCWATIGELKSRWGKVEPTESNLRKVQAWITLELAKRDEANPIMFLYRGPDEAWCYEFFAVLPLSDTSTGQHSYRISDISIEVAWTKPESFAADRDSGLKFDEVLIELKASASKKHQDLRGGYFIMPRNVYTNSNSKS